MDYYKILNVAKTATQEEIKKAYKKLAMEHHPDRGGSTAKFAEINEAYETLKDPKKRQEYDSPRQEFNFNSQNFEDIFSAFFNNAGMRNRKNRDLKLTVSITLEEVLTGKDLIANYTLANGQNTTANIKIHPGVQHGEAIRYKGMGDNGISSLPRGDLIIYINIIKHKIFERDGRNLKTVVEVNTLDLILGTKISIKTLTDNQINVNIPKGTNPGTILSVAGFGLPDSRAGITGNLYITIKGKTPKIDDENILARIKQINDEVG